MPLKVRVPEPVLVRLPDPEIMPVTDADSLVLIVKSLTVTSSQRTITTPSAPRVGALSSVLFLPPPPPPDPLFAIGEVAADS